MANNILSNPMVLDTPSTSAVVLARSIEVTGIVWDQGASGANGDIALIRDQRGIDKWSQTLLTGNLVPAAFAPTMPISFDGIIMHTLGHGKVYVYYKS